MHESISWYLPPFIEKGHKKHDICSCISWLVCSMVYEWFSLRYVPSGVDSAVAWSNYQARVYWTGSGWLPLKSADTWFKWTNKNTKFTRSNRCIHSHFSKTAVQNVREPPVMVKCRLGWPNAQEASVSPVVKRPRSQGGTGSHAQLPVTCTIVTYIYNYK